MNFQLAILLIIGSVVPSGLLNYPFVERILLHRPQHFIRVCTDRFVKTELITRERNIIVLEITVSRPSSQRQCLSINNLTIKLNFCSNELKFKLNWYIGANFVLHTFLHVGGFVHCIICVNYSLRLYWSCWTKVCHISLVNYVQRMNTSKYKWNKKNYNMCYML